MWSIIRASLPPGHARYYEITAAAPGQARDAAEAAARSGADLIVAVGGDGTLNEALNGVMTVPEGHRPDVAFLPGGTANILARALGLPRTIQGIGSLLRAGARRRIDVGLVNGRYYATIAGAGFDAEVVAGTQRLRRWIGSKPAHVARIVTTLFRYRAPAARIRVNASARVIPLTFLAAANTEWYGGGLRLAPGARPDDGQLLVIYGTDLSRLQLLEVMAGSFTGQHLGHPRVTHQPATLATIESDHPIALHADGEWLGRWPSIRFEIVPRAVRILVPPRDGNADGRER
jgi:YegS/Rv2252/BmrU family lipid kinase